MATYESQIENLIGEDINASLTDVLQIDVTNWMAEGLQTIVNVLPEDMLWMLEADTKEYSEADAVHGVSVGTNKILYVQRLSDSNLTDSDGDGVADAKMLVECREVPASLRGRVKAGSGWKEESSETDPVWYKLGKRIYVEPAPTDYISSGSEFGAVGNLSKASGSTSFEPYGTYSSTGATGYEVEVTSVLDGIDRFKWSKGDSLQDSNLAMNAFYTWQFASSAQSWTLGNATGATNADEYRITSTGGTVTFESPAISVDGSKCRYISLRVRSSDVTYENNWYGRLHYVTSSHSYSDSFYARFDPDSANAWETVTLDMHQGLNAGGADWKNSTITKLRFQLFVTNGGNTGSGDTFDISNMIVGKDDDSGVLTVGTPSTNSVHATQPWIARTNTAVNYTDNSSGAGATFDVVVDSDGVATVTVKNYGKGFAVDDTFTVTGDTLGNASADDLTFSITSLFRPQGNNFDDGVYIRWADSSANHTVGDKYEFSAEPSNRSKVYYISHPSGWKYDSDYLTGAVPKEIDPIVLNYVAARALEQKLANIQNGSSASLEQYIIDEDIDLAQAQQVLIQDTHALIDRYTKEYQMGIQGLMTGTYAPQSTGGEKQQPAYSNVAQ